MKTIFIFGLILISSCSTHNHHNSSQHHMHQRSHEDLIKSFDHPKRDEWQKPEFVISQMGALKGKSVIDIGTGSGYFLKYFLRENALVTAADIDEKFLSHIEKTYSKKSYPLLKTKKVLINNPLMDKAQFDIAFMSNTYHHVDNRVEYLKKIYQGLNSRGIFVNLDYSPTPKSEQSHQGPPLRMRITVDQVKEELTLAGFHKIKVFEREFPYHYLVIASK